ncbi:MAG: glycosyltransferase [Candidatus Eisenbacteria sp.]|nr:glycosyltransferase [Candidatus Eisenbacteria bacterium]
MSSPASLSPAPPVVSIILVHYRTPHLLERCLETIAAAPGEATSEILILDNDPLDDAAGRLAQRFGARCLHNEKNLGYGRAINQGLAEARGEFFLILNPDIEVRPGAIDALVDFMRAEPAAGIVGPRLLDPDGSLQYSARTSYTLRVILLRRTPLGRLWPNARAVRDHLMMDWDHNDVRDVDWLIGGAIMVRRAAVADVGGMDERFFLYFEDVDWCSRMQRRGWRVVYVPQAEMIHAHQRASAGGFLTRGQRMHLESALRFYEKWSLVLYVWKRQATRLRTLATLLSDLVLLSAAFLAAYFTRYALGSLFPGWEAAKPVFALQVYARFIPFADLIAVLTFSFLGLYRGEVWRNRWCEFFQLVKGIAIISLIVLGATFLFTTRPLSRFTVLIYFPYGLVLVALGREALRRLVAGVRQRRIQLRRLGVFAPREQLRELERRFAEHGRFGYEPITLAHEEETEPIAGGGGDPVERRIRFLENERIAEVVVFESREHAELLGRLLPRLLHSGLPVIYVPLGEQFVRQADQLRDFMGFGALGLGEGRRRVGGWLKRGLDLGLALFLLAVGFPAHLLVRAGQRGAPLLAETRISRGGRTCVLRRYPGRPWLLRRLPCLAHYPALLSVVGGAMSFVGITALTPEQWSAADEAYRRTAPDAPAGILSPLAGYAQDGEAGLARILAQNQAYAHRWSLGEDLRIALQALFDRGAERGERS